MKFTSDELRRLTAALPLFMSKAAARLSATFRRRQPDFCQMIGEVGLDPRCVRAHAFCVAFCAVALASNRLTLSAATDSRFSSEELALTAGPL